MRKELKAQRKRLDVKFSIYIRLRDDLKCKYCKTFYPLVEGKIPQGLHCAHIISRTYIQTRWFDMNAYALCAGHHFHFHRRPDEFKKWLLEKSILNKETYNYLYQRAQRIEKFDLTVFEMQFDEFLKIQLRRYPMLNYRELKGLY